MTLQEQAKIRSYRTLPKHKFRHETHRNNDYEHVINIDKKSINHVWTDSSKLEIDQQHQCDTVKGMGKGQHSKG